MRAGALAAAAGGVLLAAGCRCLLGGPPPVPPRLPQPGDPAYEAGEFHGTFAGSAVPGPSWSFDGAPTAFFKQPFLGQVFTGVVAFPAQVDRIGGAPVEGWDRILVNGIVNGPFEDGLVWPAAPDGPRAIVNAWSCQTLAVDAGLAPVSVLHEFATGTAARTDAGDQLALRLGFDGWPPFPPGVWGELALAQQAEGAPEPIPALFLPLSFAAAPGVRYPDTDRYHGDWLATVNRTLCVPGTGQCVDLAGELVLRLEPVPRAIAIPRAYEGVVQGWGRFDGTVDGEPHGFLCALSGVVDRLGEVEAMVSVELPAIDKDCFTGTFTGGTHYHRRDLASLMGKLALTPGALANEESLSFPLLGNAIELRRDRRANTPPTVRLLPPDATALAPDAPAEVRVEYADAEDGAPPEPWRWRWSQDGGLPAAITPTADPARFRWNPTTRGAHVLRVEVRDEGGLRASDEVALDFPGHAPEPEILQPAGGATLALAPGLVVLEGCAWDRDDWRIEDAGLAWSSDRDGPLGSGRRLVVSLASAGAHVITLRATDPQGQSRSTSIAVQVQAFPQTPPVVWIESPERVACSEELAFTRGETLRFVAGALDAEDGAAVSFSWGLQELPGGAATVIGTGPFVDLTIQDDPTAPATTSYRLLVRAIDSGGLGVAAQRLITAWNPRRVVE